MDSAEEAELRQALSQQKMLLGRQQEELEASRRAYSQVSFQMNRLVERMDRLQVSLPAVRGATPAHGPEGTVHRYAEPWLNPPHSLLRRAQFMMVISVPVLADLHSPAFQFSHRAFQSSVHHYTLDWSSKGVGHGRLGWRACLLSIVGGILGGVAQGLRSLSLGN